MAPNKFPKKIEVRIEEDGDSTYLLAQDAREDNDGQHGDKVAVYGLIEVLTLHVDKSLRGS